jgi:preprotein translocase subunit Sss1
MENLKDLLDEPKEFIKDSVHLLNRCSKPDQRGI